MNVKANWHVSGVSFDSSIDAFIKSAKYATSTENLKKHEAHLNHVFKEYINTNTRLAGMEADNIADVFTLTINSQGVNFTNMEPLVTQRYEYGYYDGSNDTNEEYYEEYIMQTSPRFFIRPAIQQTLNDIGYIMLEDAKKEYTLLREWQDETL